jgi:hypothetical protein
MGVQQSSRHRCVAASFDGVAWDCYALRKMPDRHWAVLHNRGPTIAPRLRSGSTELVVGLQTFAAAHDRARGLASEAFSRGSATDRRRPHVPRLVPLRVEPDAQERRGAADRIGPPMRAVSGP